MFSKKFLEKCNKAKLIAKLLSTYEKIQEKANIITKLEKDLIYFESESEISKLHSEIEQTKM